MTKKMVDFQNIFGHEREKELLTKIIVHNQINHAYLFTGNESIGKKMMATAFSKAINCKSKDSLRLICNTCSSCVQIESQTHPDFKLIKPSGKGIRIGQIRELKSDIYLKPVENIKKIYIIDDAHLMNEEAANSLLKILEEPPEYAIIILITPFRDALLSTIVSRCSQVKFRSLSGEKQLEIFRNIMPSCPEEKMRQVLLLSRGNIGQGIMLLSDQEKQKELDFIIDSLKSIKPEKMVEFAFVSNKTFEKFLNSFSYFVRIVTLWFRDMLLYKTGIEDMIIYQDRIEDLKKNSNIYSINQVISILKYLTGVNGYMEKNLNEKTILENFFIQLGD